MHPALKAWRVLTCCPGRGTASRPAPALSFPTNRRRGSAHQPRGQDLTILRVSVSWPPPPVVQEQACAVGGHFSALAHFRESGAGPRSVRLLCSSAVRARDVGGGAATVAPGNGGGRRRRRRRRDSAGGWWVWGPGPLRSWPVTPLPSSGPGRGTTRKAEEGMGRSGSWIGFGGRRGAPTVGHWKETWAWGGRRGLQESLKLREGAGSVCGHPRTEPRLHHY